MIRKIKNSTAIDASDAAYLSGTSQLLIDAVEGVTDIVEDLHCHIAGVAPMVGKSSPGRTRGITGLVYRSVRGVTRAVGLGLDAGFAQLTPLLSKQASSLRREAVLAALNGVFGDYLIAHQNPLAITMQLRQHGRSLVLDKPTLATDFPAFNGKLLVLVHGLCMNDLQWNRERLDHSASHDHGASLARDLGYTPIYLHYNSGRHIATNGAAFAVMLEQLLEAWPVAVSELTIIGHSMGGLVARSACLHASEANHTWPQRLKKIIFLGTPHHGAPLERAGNWVDMLLDISPYTAPFARLGKVRSAGIKDLRYGRIMNEELPGRKPLQLTRNINQRVKYYAIAATKQKQASGDGTRLRSDGLVPVRSALGLGQLKNNTLPHMISIPVSRQRICYGLDHFDLLSSSEVYDQIYRWLAK